MILYMISMFIHACMSNIVYDDNDVASYVWYNIYCSVIFPWHEIIPIDIP